MTPSTQASEAEELKRYNKEQLTSPQLENSIPQPTDVRLKPYEPETEGSTGHTIPSLAILLEKRDRAD